MRHALFRRKSKSRKRSKPTCSNLPEECTPVVTQQGLRTSLGEGADTKPRGCVHFGPTLTVSEVLHISDYKPEEIHACWYDTFEANEIREENKFTVTLEDKGPEVCVDVPEGIPAGDWMILVGDPEAGDLGGAREVKVTLRDGVPGDWCWGFATTEPGTFLMETPPLPS